MKRFLIFFFALIFLVQCRSSDKHIYVLIGQSNMAGRGKLASQDTLVYPRVLTLTKDSIWVPAKDPIHFDKPEAGVGLGRTFGIEMAKTNPSSIIYLVPCAVGGSSIKAWKPGGYHAQTNSHPWDDAEKRIKLALKTGTLKGVLWLQGESDSNPEGLTYYAAELDSLIQRIYALNDNKPVPFIAGELGKFYQEKNGYRYPDESENPSKMLIKQTQQVLANYPMTGLVHSNYLTHIGDSTHFDAESQRILGKRFAKVMKALMQ
jgi:hypothetical protein